MEKLLPLAVVPTLIWVAVWFYLWMLDKKVKHLEREMRLIEELDKDNSEELKGTKRK